MIRNWKLFSFTFHCKWWVSALIYLPWMQILKWVPNGYFLLIVNFLLMATNFTRTCFHLSQNYLCLICNGRKTERECMRERKLPHWRKPLQGKFWRFFFKISSLFLYEMFSWPKLFIPDEKSPCRIFCLTNTISEDTLIYVKKKL